MPRPRNPSGTCPGAVGFFFAWDINRAARASRRLQEVAGPDDAYKDAVCIPAFQRSDLTQFRL